MEFDYNFLENGIKLISKSDIPFNIRLVGILTGLNLPYDSFFETKMNKRGYWIIPNFKLIGFSLLEVYINNEFKYTISVPSHLNYNEKKNKIICIGLNKTGTTSFKDSLSKCGLKVFNEEYGHQYLMQDVHNDNIYSTLSAVENSLYDVYEDAPFSFTNLYKDLFKFRPEDYYVLTIRNSDEEFAESAYKFYFDVIKTHDKGKFNSRYAWKYRTQNKKVITLNHINCLMSNWGITHESNLISKLKDVYNKHLDETTNFFEKEKDSKFITINVAKENELKRLSTFVGFNTVDNNFLWSNKSKN